jgi:molybdate transport system regulatory protein
LGRSVTKPATAPALIVRIKLGRGSVLGPGKADLLERIDRLGSISAAAREMRMSYRQAWTRLDTMNEVFRGRVVETSQGGPRGGGTVLTSLGRAILVCYRTMQGKALESVRADLEALAGLMAPSVRRSLRRRPR